MGKRGGKDRSGIGSFRGSSPPPGAVGSYESVNRPYYPNMEEGSASGVMLVRSPSLTIKVDIPAMATFVRLLTLMDKSGFPTVLKYVGSDVSGTDIGDDGTSLEGFLLALERMQSQDEGGRRLTAVLRDVHDPKVNCRVDVRPGRRTRALVKVKGRIPSTRWATLKRRVGRRFKLTL